MRVIQGQSIMKSFNSLQYDSLCTSPATSVLQKIKVRFVYTAFINEGLRLSGLSEECLFMPGRLFRIRRSGFEDVRHSVGH